MRPRLATQVALVTTLVAAVAVLVAALVALPLARSAAERQARDSLSNQLDLVASAADREGVAPAVSTAVLARQRIQLSRQGIDLVVVEPAGALPRGLDDLDAATLSDGRSVSDVRNVDGADVLIEARARPTGGALVLIEPLDVARGAAGEDQALRRLGAALIIGLAFAVVAGLLLAQRLGRPLQRASTAAQRLATGARDVRLEPEGPLEVADLSVALNQLAGALQNSEGRQRDFLLSVSHELRTPLTAVKGYAEALADGVVPADQVPETGATVLDEARRLERLVNDLLDLARFGAQDLRLDVELTDLNELMSDAATVWTARCSRVGVELRSELPGMPLLVRTDPTRLRQIVDNLAENALRVTPSGAPIVLALHVEPGTVVVEVRDGGPGLTPDDLVVAFQPAALFTRYRGVRKVGSGVGLALVGTLASRLGGVAEAGRSPEGGARFAVRIPSADGG